MVFYAWYEQNVSSTLHNGSLCWSQCNAMTGSPRARLFCIWILWSLDTSPHSSFHSAMVDDSRWHMTPTCWHPVCFHISCFERHTSWINWGDVWNKMWKLVGWSIWCLRWILIIWLRIFEHYNFSPPTGGFFLATAESCSLWLQHKGPSSPKVILPDEQTTGLREVDTPPTPPHVFRPVHCRWWLISQKIYIRNLTWQLLITKLESLVLNVF